MSDNTVLENAKKVLMKYKTARDTFSMPEITGELAGALESLINEKSELTVKTPQGSICAKAHPCESYPAIDILVKIDNCDHLVAVVEHDPNKGLRVHAYAENQDEPSASTSWNGGGM